MTEEIATRLQNECGYLDNRLLSFVLCGCLSLSSSLEKHRQQAGLRLAEHRTPKLQRIGTPATATAVAATGSRRAAACLGCTAQGNHDAHLTPGFAPPRRYRRLCYWLQQG